MRTDGRRKRVTSDSLESEGTDADQATAAVFQIEGQVRPGVVLEESKASSQLLVRVGELVWIDQQGTFSVKQQPIKPPGSRSERQLP